MSTSIHSTRDERVLVTGLGIYCSVADDVPAFHAALLDSTKGFRQITEFDVAGCRTGLAAKLGYVRERATRSGMRGNVLLACAVDEAVADAALVGAADGGRVAVTMGTSLGGMAGYVDWMAQREAAVRAGAARDDASRQDASPADTDDDSDPAPFASPLNPYNRLRGHEFVLNIPPSLIACELAREFGWSAGTASCVTACSAGANSIAIGADFIRSGRADVVVAGAVDALTPLTFMGFHSLMALTKTEPAPFDNDRGGLLIGEGAAVVVLESAAHARERGVRAYAELAGYGLSNDAYHVTQPHPEGLGAILAMRQSLCDAGLDGDQVDYVNMHGTGTRYNDLMELKAMREVFGERASHIPISSIKSAVGHTLGAAGTVEAVATVLALYHDFLPANLNMTRRIEGMEYDVVTAPRTGVRIDAAMSNSFAFGGNCASLVFRRVA